jgi:hypothetical protein
MKSFFLFACSLALFSSACAVDISNLQSCIDDVKTAAARDDTVTLFTTNYNQLMDALTTPEIKQYFPSIYQQEVLDPFVQYLERMGEWGFTSIFSDHPTNPQADFLKEIIPDISEALLQTGEGYAQKSTHAFEELVSDLYDGFLSEEDRVSKETGVQIKLPDRTFLAPLVKWGSPDAGPYTWPIDATSALDLQSAIVNLPPTNLKGGLMAWATIPHETGGHDILHADTGLLEELGDLAYNAVLAKFPTYKFLASYWRDCIDETASDVAGLLNAGPIAGISLIGYFRGLMGGGLRNVGQMPPGDTHPVDILRGFIAARIVEQLSFSEAKDWADAIRQEVKKDLRTIYLVDAKGSYYRIPQQVGIQSAETVADLIANSKLSALEGHSLKEIQDWTDKDQCIVEELATLLREGQDLPSDFRNSGYYATHVVAAAIQEALKAGAAPVQTFFDRMLSFLDIMHQYNNVWTMSPMASCMCGCSCKNCSCSSNHVKKERPVFQSRQLTGAHFKL